MLKIGTTLYGAPRIYGWLAIFLICVSEYGQAEELELKNIFTAAGYSPGPESSFGSNAHFALELYSCFPVESMALN